MATIHVTIFLPIHAGEAKQKTFIAHKRLTRKSNIIWNLNWISSPFFRRYLEGMGKACEKYLSLLVIQLTSSRIANRKYDSQMEFSLNAYLHTRFEYVRRKSLNIAFSSEIYWLPSASRKTDCETLWKFKVKVRTAFSYQLGTNIQMYNTLTVNSFSFTSKSITLAGYLDNVRNAGINFSTQKIAHKRKMFSFAERG